MMVNINMYFALAATLIIPMTANADQHIGKIQQPQKVVKPVYLEYPTIVHSETGVPYRLDWCYQWGTGCGAEAAKAFCNTVGYSDAYEWQKDENIGAKTPTLVINDRKICAQEFCDGFEFIACSRK